MVFDCSICDNSYNSSRALRRHVKEKHDKTRFKCICGKDFSRKFTLYKHMNNCMEGNNSILNKDVLSGGECSVAQSYDKKLNSLNDITSSLSETNNNLLDSPNDENEADEEGDDEIISKPSVKRYRSRKPKISSGDEEDEVVPRPRMKRIRNSLNFQNGSGTDTDRSKINGVSDIFSTRNSVETDSEENSSDESDSKHSKICYCRNCYSTNQSRNCKYIHSKKGTLNDQSKEGNDSEESSSDKSDSEHSKICYCRDCYSAQKSKTCKYIHSKKGALNDQSKEGNDSEESSTGESDSEQSKLCYCRNCYSAKKSRNFKYVHSKKEKSDDQSEGKNDSEMDEVEESDEERKIDEGFNLYNQYYKSQASGGGIFSTIIGNSNRTGNIGGGLSSLYRSSTTFPIGKIIGNTIGKPVSSYLP